MHSTMAESVQEIGIKENHKVIQGRRHFWRSHCPASCSKKGQYQNQTGLLMALSGQTLAKCGDGTIPVQLIPLLHSAQDEHLFHINNLNVSIGQRKRWGAKGRGGLIQNDKLIPNGRLTLHSSGTARPKYKQLESKRYWGGLWWVTMGKFQVKYRKSNSS